LYRITGKDIRKLKIIIKAAGKKFLNLARISSKVNIDVKVCLTKKGGYYFLFFLKMLSFRKFLA